MPETWTGAVPPESAGRRLDVFLAEHCPALSRSQAKRLIEAGEVTVEGRPGRPRTVLRAGWTVSVSIPAPQPTDLAAEDLPLHIIHEDADLLVIDKPAGMLTHPGGGQYRGTLVNALLAHCTDLSGIGGEVRPGIVHRLDRDTTGLLVVAKHDRAHRHLADQLRARTAHREYLAIVYGEPEWEEITVDAPVGRSPQRRTEMAVTATGRAARTHLACRERFGLAALLAARLESGRTHQVRVHCHHIGHPLMGDPAYGRKRARQFGPLPPAVAEALAGLPGQALHAYRLEFTHPADELPRCFEVPPPAAFRALLEALRVSSGGP
ncbi:MAG: RluA family pseudouridine synthase [Armatimonadetes bacterium]|nr:RluA family pseudouridine synthase [Armatimonadota bacterium]